MVTNAGEPGDGVTKADVAERAAALKADAHRGARYLLTGSDSGRMRRNLLFAVTAGLIVYGLPLLALIPLLLLALTDSVVID